MKSTKKAINIEYYLPKNTQFWPGVILTCATAFGFLAFFGVREDRRRMREVELKWAIDERIRKDRNDRKETNERIIRMFARDEMRKELRKMLETTPSDKKN